ncbi:MAG: 2,4-dihydroxyhept-2-ene-1,7-dioic acid aldolase [Anaerolineae bacterium]|nr:2,4-dihydroxyhept-2-ene-1,7-dioic acid aldolase [Anaerolineae bacterium]
MRANRLRQLLQSGKPTIAARTATVWPDVVELIGNLGIYDYVEYAAEYGTFGYPDLDNYCRAAELYGLGTMIKIDQEPKLPLAQRAIGSGFESVLFVDCRTVEEVKYCVRICRPDTPYDGGLFGAAGRRFAYTGGGREEFAQALRDVVVAIMMEKAPLVEQLEEVLAIPGVDMIQWGPSDFTMSSGLYAKPNFQAEVKRVERKVFETCIKMGVPPRVELQNLDNVEYYLEMGVKHFRIGHDMAVLRDYWKTQGEGLRKLVESA